MAKAGTPSPIRGPTRRPCRGCATTRCWTGCPGPRPPPSSKPRYKLPPVARTHEDEAAEVEGQALAAADHRERRLFVEDVFRSGEKLRALRLAAHPVSHRQVVIEHRLG